jgi:mono/diheme cytochrome c family protein
MRRLAETAPAWLAALAALGLAAATEAAEFGDPAAGRVVALKSCAGCHVVAERQARPGMDGAPPFVALARDPAVTEISLRAFLQTPHARMPDLILTTREIDDVISYIASLRRR